MPKPASNTRFLFCLGVGLLDLEDPPSESGRIEPATTWNFQFWFRDPAAGGSGWNLSDALGILFCP